VCLRWLPEGYNIALEAALSHRMKRRGGRTEAHRNGKIATFAFYDASVALTLRRVYRGM
jgi:hypothetical protein